MGGFRTMPNTASDVLARSFLIQASFAINKAVIKAKGNLKEQSTSTCKTLKTLLNNRYFPQTNLEITGSLLEIFHEKDK